MLKISAVYLIGKAEIPIHYTIWALVEQALLREFWSEKAAGSYFNGIHFICKLQIGFPNGIADDFAQ